MRLHAALAAAAIAVAGCQPPPPMSEYVSKDGKFKVKFPGEPKITSKAAAGMVVKMYTAETWNRAFMVGWTDAPIPSWESETRTKSRLFDARDGALAAVNGKSNGTTKVIDLDGRFPGLQFGGTADSKHLRAKVYIVGHRVYQLLAVGRSDEVVNSPEADDFFQSFELIDPPPPVAKPGAPAPAAAAPPPPPDPKFIESTSGKFQARYPAKPKKVTRTVGGLNFTGYETVSRAGTCAVLYADLPDAASPDQAGERLEAARDAAVKDIGGTLAESKSVSLGKGQPGLEFTAAADGKQLRGRVYLVGSRLYQVTVHGPEDYPSSKTADQFYASFKLTK